MTLPTTPTIPDDLQGLTDPDRPAEEQVASRPGWLVTLADRADQATVVLLVAAAATTAVSTTARNHLR